MIPTNFTNLILRPQHWLFIAASDEKLTKTVFGIDNWQGSYCLKVRDPTDPREIRNPIDIVMELQDLSVLFVVVSH